MDRDDALAAFLAVLNVLKPEHPYFESPYPVTADEVQFGSTQTAFASCGPRFEDNFKVKYSTRLNYINSISRERHLAVLTHEVTHVTIPYRKQHRSNHPPDFWREMAHNALLVEDSLTEGRLAEIFPDADKAKFRHEVILDPNRATVDQRNWSTMDCSAFLKHLIFERDKWLEDKYHAFRFLRWKDKRVKYSRSESEPSRSKNLIDFPGIGRQVVVNIGTEYEFVEEMVDRKELDSLLADTVSAQFHDELWYQLRSYVDYEKLPENGIHRPSRLPKEIYFENGNRTLPSDEELREHLTNPESSRPNIFG